MDTPPEPWRISIDMVSDGIAPNKKLGGFLFRRHPLAKREAFFDVQDILLCQRMVFKVYFLFGFSGRVKREPGIDHSG